MSRDFEVFPSGSVPTGVGEPVEWGSDRTCEIDSTLDPWLSSLGQVSPQTVDLVRIATAAYVADRRTKRRSLPRSIRLFVHVMRPDLQSDESITLASDLLGFLTGDIWSIERLQDSSTTPGAREIELTHTENVALLSGGLDSFAHAATVCTTGSSSSTVFVSHISNPMTARAQNACVDYLQSVAAGVRYRGVRLRHRTPKEELTNHSRSLLFMMLGVAVADGLGARRVLVPENGFTSLNVPLSPNRQGRYSTRSTHPYTFYLIGRLLQSSGISVTVSNPHEWETKGQLVSNAWGLGGDAFAQAAAKTLSCGKLDGYRYGGGNANIGCGLCYACMVRRAAFYAAGVEDKTSYLMDTLAGPSRADLITRRAEDMRAVRHAVRMGVDEDELLANTPLPPHFDLNRALRLWKNGLDELSALELPVD